MTHMKTFSGEATPACSLRHFFAVGSTVKGGGGREIAHTTLN